jgi:nicotinate-nucleotide pyrophosphorylase (carboxylating)
MNDDLNPPGPAVRDAVARALAEDLTPLGDLTSALLPPDAKAAASFVARREGVVAGVACALETFAQLDPSLVVTFEAHDGDEVTHGQAFGHVEGTLHTILTAERTALNFLCHLSGIATLTRRYVRAAGGRARIWDTRKTTPGLRALEKAAVRAGGGFNHRGNLSDWVLLKDNHVAYLGISGGVRRAQARWPGRTVHVECDRVEQVQEAVAAGATAVLLDNMTPDGVRAAVKLVEKTAEAVHRSRPLIEVSGAISLDTVGEYSGTGVDLISVGALTHSAPVLDIGLDIDEG